MTCKRLFFISFILKSAEDLILNPKDHPDAKIGDVVEIYLPEDDGIRLLLQITSFQEPKGTKGTMSAKFISIAISRSGHFL